MDKRLYLINLYDYYSVLSTEKQCNYFEDYYFNNLSLKEISDNEQISRNAVFKQLKNIENKLTNYEEKLNLYCRDQKLRKIIEKITDQQIKKELEEL